MSRVWKWPSAMLEMMVKPKIAAINPIEGMPIDGKPPSSTPNARLARMMKNRGRQAHFPILSPPSTSTTSEVNSTTAPISASTTPSISGK